MKRDMDLIRTILLAIEDSDAPAVDASTITPEGWDSDLVARHMKLLIDAGFVDGEVATYISGNMSALARDLTWEGHDFLDAVRNDSVWHETRDTIGKKLGTASFDVIKAVAAAAAMKHLGL